MQRPWILYYGRLRNVENSMSTPRGLVADLQQLQSKIYGGDGLPLYVHTSPTKLFGSM